MKLTNPILAKQIRSWYNNNWLQDDVKKYLSEHHGIYVNTLYAASLWRVVFDKRTLKHWKKWPIN